ncbi:MAG TPA: 3-oxoacyl-[acyl-carrier-protein] synthase III C-terminal domain-containing protein [Candidatus Kapabacteria bacterium]|nr:3-oxoacyl-[acyl-carrier-protein] synthase III C-terminal domain-containing protein [Candidatus Kapabacteria bacterium]
MPRIAGVATALPQYKLAQEDAKAFARKVFGDRPAIDKLLSVFDNSLIDERSFVVDHDWFEQPHDFTEVNDLYIEKALELSKEAICKLSDQLGFALDSIDAIIFISTTGLSTPSIDARLFNILPFNKHIKRIPIWGLGCAGGAAGIARAHDIAKGDPKARVLVVSVELCGLAFQKNDKDKSSIIATALFGDGAAACLVVGDNVEATGPTIADTMSTIYTDTLDVMGWRITGEGFKVVLSRDIPTIVRSLVHENIGEMLSRNSLDYSDLSHFVAHPGGKKVLEAYEEALGLDQNDLRHSYGVLKDHGNMSSATVFFILERYLKDRAVTEGYGLLSALGPGFCSELVLLKW